MNNFEILKEIGIEEKPPYWDFKYMKNLDKISKPIYDVKVEKDIFINARDGIKLCIDIFRPDSEGVFPVLVAWSSYNKSIQSLDRAPIPIGNIMFDHTIEAGDIDFFVKRGYIIIIADARGVGKSEGKWDGIYGLQEQEDCYDLIEWAGVQCWSNENVGMVGISYFSILQPLVAMLQPPHLKAIMPIEVVDNLYHHNYPGGVFIDRSYMYVDFCPALEGLSESERTMSEEELKNAIEERLSDPDIRTHANLVRVLSCWPPKYHTYFLDVLLHKHDDEFWMNRSMEGKCDKIKIPVYLTSEYYEFGRFTQGPLKAFADETLSVPKKVMLNEPHKRLKLPYQFANLEILRWYDHWLKGIDTGIMDEPPVKIFVMGRNQIKFENEWPIARTEWTKFYLSSNSKLSQEVEKGIVEPDIFTHVPPTQVPIKEKDIPLLKYSTEKVETDMEITGHIALYLNASINVDDGNFVTSLYDVDCEGNKTLLSTGCLKASNRTIIEEKSKPYLPAHDHTKSVLIEPDKIYEYVIELIPTSNLFKKGHCVEVEIKAMNPMNFSWIGPIPSSRTMEYKIYHDENHPSYLYMPVIPYTPEEQWIE